MDTVADHTMTDTARRSTTEPARPVRLLRELRALPELGLFAATAPGMAFLAPTGPPRPVLVLPGFVSSDTATLPLRAFLRAIGHRPRGWRLGLNVGPAEHVAAGVDRALKELADEWGCPVDIVGWSLGGIYGRILASHRPDHVRQVISLGSPVRMHASQTNIEQLFRRMGALWGFTSSPRRIDLDRVPVPSTTVWTRTDGVVPGTACRQTPRPRAEAIEVYGSHTGLGHNASVHYLVADRLALPADEWRPFEPPSMLGWLYPTIEGG